MDASTPVTRWAFDELGQQEIFHRSQECGVILDDATRRRNEGLHGSSEMRHAARLPVVAVERYCNDAGISFSDFCANPEHARKMLNDPALAGFRVWEGRV